MQYSENETARFSSWHEGTVKFNFVKKHCKMERTVSTNYEAILAWKLKAITIQIKRHISSEFAIAWLLLVAKLIAMFATH